MPIHPLVQACIDAGLPVKLDEINHHGQLEDLNLYSLWKCDSTSDQWTCIICGHKGLIASHEKEDYFLGHAKTHSPLEIIARSA